MKSKSHLLLAVASLCLGMLAVTTARAASYSIANMNITSGGFVAYDYLGQPVDNPSSGGAYTPFTTIGSNTNLVGGYLGSPSSGVVSGIWYGGPAIFYTASSNMGTDITPAGSIQGGPVPSGTLDGVGGTITMDLSAFFASWGVDFHQGTGKIDGVTSLFATGTWDSNSGFYSLSWISNIAPTVCGPLGATCLAQYTLEGYASPVPTPAAAYLLLSGLIGLVGFARNRKIA